MSFMLNPVLSCACTLGLMEAPNSGKPTTSIEPGRRLGHIDIRRETFGQIRRQRDHKIKRKTQQDSKQAITLPLHRTPRNSCQAQFPLAHSSWERTRRALPMMLDFDVGRPAKAPDCVGKGAEEPNDDNRLSSTVRNGEREILSWEEDPP